MSTTLFRLVFGRKMAALQGIPGPTPSFPLGNARDFLGGKKPWEVFAEYGKTYGGMSLVWALGVPVVVLNDPDLIAQVLNAKSADYYKDAPRGALKPVITERCLFIVNGDDWAYRRANHPCQGPAADDWMTTLKPILRESITTAIGRMASKSEGDLYDGLQRVAFDAFAETVFGSRFGDDAYQQFMTLGKMGDRRMQNPALVPLPPACPMFYLDRKKWYGRFDDLIARARKGDDPGRRDLLALTLKHGTKLNHADLRDLLANAFYGGVFSVSSGLTTALYLLAHNPAEREKLMADLESQGTETPRVEATIREALRYLAPVPMMARNVVTTRPVELGGHTLPANTMMVLTSWKINRSDHWTDPDAFQPDRWLEGGSEANPIGSAHFLPFGEGPRMCVGMPFAMTYMNVALSTILTRYAVDFDLSKPYQMGYFFGVMMPKGLAASFKPVALDRNDLTEVHHPSTC